MSNSVKEPVIYAVAATLAIVAGVWIASGSWAALGLLLAAAIFCAVAYLAPQGAHLGVLAVLLCGYVLGNRGFAQLSPAAGLPLFPAEAGLLLSCSLLFIQCCALKRLPVFADALNFCLLAWMAVGATRILFDIKNHGFAAIRDFALVYYAVFFFLAQWALLRKPNPSGWLHRWLLPTTALLLPMYFLFTAYPTFFTDTLTFRGLPLIFYKGDLIGTLLSVGSVVWFIYYEEDRRRLWALLLSLALAGAMLTTDNRASLLALIVPALFLALKRRWNFVRALSIAGVAGALCIVLWTFGNNRRIQDTPLYSMHEKVVSLTDLYGTRTYSGTGSAPKGDNNRFRVVWWQTVVTDTVDANPYVGVGFGYDLADTFLKTYYPDSTDEFSARSPHNVFVTIFARMGILGVAAFVAFLIAVARRTFSALRHENRPHAGIPWLVGWSILTAACFGVVLEGPMGAVLFWIALGAGNAQHILNLERSSTAEKSPAPTPGSAEFSEKPNQAC